MCVKSILYSDYSIIVSPLPPFAVEWQKVTSEVTHVHNNVGNYHNSVNSLPYSQGTLLPYEKRKLELTFAPRFVSSDSGWSHFQATPTRRDYTLYLRFLAVDTNRESTSMRLILLRIVKGNDCHYVP